MSYIVQFSVQIKIDITSKINVGVKVRSGSAGQPIASGIGTRSY